MPLRDDFNFEQSSNVFFPADGTRVTLSDNAMIDTTKLPRDIQITKGRYRMTIGKPTGVVPAGFSGKTDLIQFLDDKGNFQQKRYTIDAMRYDAIKDKLYLDVTVIDNPLPLFILYGAVVAAVAIIGALTAHSVLEDISSLTENAVVKPVGELTKSPLTWAIVAIFLLPVLGVFFAKVKGK